METSTQETKDSKKFLNHLLNIKSKYSVTRVATINGFVNEKLPVAIAYRPNSKVLSQSGGKGVSNTQAIISALMESFECHSAEIAPYEKVEKESALNENVVSPTNLAITMLDYSKFELNKWVRFTELGGTSENYWLPFDAISLDFTRMVDVLHRDTFFLTSNGLASGSSWDNAAKSAIYEVIERHCITTAELSGTDTKHEVDLRNIKNEDLRKLIKAITEYQVKLNLYDNTIWKEYPTFKAVLSEGPTKWTGFGTHENIIVAVTRAITEANQARVISISGSREDMNKDFYLAVYPKDKTSGSSRLIQFADKEKSVCTKTSINATLNEFVNNVKKITNTKWYIYKYKQIDPKVYVVRVVAENLHGYNYPGYAQSTILPVNEYRANTNLYIKRDQHSPAAG